MTYSYPQPVPKWLKHRMRKTCTPPPCGWPVVSERGPAQCMLSAGHQGSCLPPPPNRVLAPAT